MRQLFVHLDVMQVVSLETTKIRKSCSRRSRWHV